MPEVHVESELPEGWLPEGAWVHIFARRAEADTHWESLIPEFSIAGMGESLEDAVQNALELLDDYLVLCARDGMTFAESYRPFGWRNRFTLAGDALAGLVRFWIGRRARSNKNAQRYRVPLRLVGVD